MLDANGEARPGEIYAKVLDGAETLGAFRVRFTSVAPEIAARLGAPGGTVAAPARGTDSLGAPGRRE